VHQHISLTKLCAVLGNAMSIIYLKIQIINKDILAMKSIFLTCLIIALYSIVHAQQVIINEIQASNVHTKTYSSEIEDWIEFYNTTSSPISLEGWELSDNGNTWVFPSKTIAADSYLLVYAVGKDYGVWGKINSSLKLSSTGETITLKDASGTVVDSVEYPELPNDISFGKLDDGTYGLMKTPSPSAENISSSAFSYLDDEITVSVASGIYESPQLIELENTSKETIYYTLDGSTPTLESPKYSQPFIVDTNTVLKALSIKSSSEIGKMQMRSYIFNVKHSLPIVLLASDTVFQERLYLNTQIDGAVEFCFIEEDGAVEIRQNANFRSTGNTSQYRPPLNGKVKADKIYGDGDFDHEMFPYKKIDEFKSFLLRNSSQDWSNSFLRDGFSSNILAQDNLFDIAFEGYRPAVLYLNGEYRGLINIREDDDNDYVETNFGLKSDEFTYKITNGIYFDQWDMSNSALRSQFEADINMQEYLSLRLMYNYTEDMDYRIVQWEDLSGKTGYRLHYNIHDFDTGLGVMGSKTDIMNNPLKIENLIPDCFKNYEPYKNEAVHYIAAQLNHIYNTNRTLRILDEMEHKLENEIPAHAVRLKELAEQMDGIREYEMPSGGYEGWKQNIDSLRENVASRIDPDIFNRIRTYYNLNEPIEISYESSDINCGYIRVQDIKIQEEKDSGTYFSDIPLRLSAHPLRGYKFVRWEGDVSGTDVNISPAFTSDATVIAVFEKIEDPINTVVINEVQTKNDTTIADEMGEYNDWIEIYNPTSAGIDMAGMFLSDNFDKPLKWKIPDTNPAKTTVPANGFLILWADSDPEQGENHLDFKLKTTDQIIITASDGITPIQYLEFSDVKADISYAATVDGGNNYILTSEPTPNASNVIVKPLKKYEVVFADYDGTVIKKEKVDSTEAATPPASPVREGYTFTGWDASFSCITADATITALYEIDTYTVKFLDYDGTVLKEETVDYRSSATAPASPERAGFTFTGWDYSFSHISSDLIITAQYKKDDTIFYTVLFVDWDGAIIKKQSVAENQSASIEHIPTREGYTFTGWDRGFENIGSDITVTAEYAINSYSVQFLDYDGTVLSEQAVDYGNDATEPDSPSREGYAFTGWDRDFENISSDITVTAEYIENSTGIFDSQIDVKIYPNLTTNYVYISHDFTDQVLQLSIINSEGKVIVLDEAIANKLHQIDFRNYANGIYTVCITSQGKCAKTKVVKQ